MKKNKFYFFIILSIFLQITLGAEAEAFTSIKHILDEPEKYSDDFVTVKGNYFGWKKAPGYPPVTRSDWVLRDKEENSIYCTGKLPQFFDPMSGSSLGKPITILARVRVKNKRPYLQVEEIKPLDLKIEQMVSVSQILFNPLNVEGKYVGLTGVLAKGYEHDGMRTYLLADPTGVIKLGRLPKLYPTGTILHLRGIIEFDKNGLPILDEIEIVEASVDFD
ncbi:MAG: hypothetical protein ACQETH_04775 [Candidatus Rifleibacteriota bacterium]